MDSGVIRNYMSLKVIKRLGLSYRQKKDLYPLVTILKNLILYKDRIIYFKTGLVELEIKRRHVVVSFNVLLLGKNKAVLEMLFLQEYNLKINWIIGDIEV